MKLIRLFYLIIIVSCSAFAQDKIVLKDGSSIIPLKETIEIVVKGKKVKYQLPGEKGSKHVGFSDLDYVSTEGKLLKSFKLNNPNKVKTKADLKFTYFILIETDKYKLISIAIYYDLSQSTKEIIYSLIIDNDNNVVADLSFICSEFNQKIYQDQKNAIVLVRKYFGSLKPEMDALTANEQEVSVYFKAVQYRKYN
ncbi:MAG: hypothetical protein H7239_02070 [Flavobacterium sp.]|nr:hypothetical protein [Flavobacterium sp.]